MISPIQIPGLFITGTSTDIGKTVIAGAIARWFLKDHRRVAVSKPIATGCVHRREGWVSEDAEYLAHCADSPHPLDLISPVRYAEPLAPAIAANRSGVPVDYEAIERSHRLMTPDSDVMIVEGIGGILVPLDDQHTVLDLAQWLGLPVVIVAHASLGTINHTLLTLMALKSRKIPIAGVVINRYPPGTPGIAEETNPKAIEKFGKVPLLCVAGEDKVSKSPSDGAPTPKGIMAAINTVDWWKLANKRK